MLYGAYAFAEKLGVRFYLHGDVVPDSRVRYSIPLLDEVRQPLFDVRGIQPFHDFPEGPDWWNRDDYLAYVTQLSRMRMNFLGLHCYPEGGVGPEPLVWIGLKQDLGDGGRVRFSYPAFWANTAKGAWGYAPMKTSQFAGGAAMLFAQDDYGPDVMDGLMPKPVGLEQANLMFERVGAQMSEVFAHARQLGVRTCVGTETPLTIPKPLRDHLAELGMNLTNAATVRALYAGMFTRIAQTCPVDYYWLWTPEDWTWGGNKPGQLEATINDLQLALDALSDLGHPFKLATSGWVLGPAHNRAALDEFLPKTSPMSCINRQVGHEGVEPAFADIRGRPKWAIPWMENDPNMVGPQPWVARMRYDAADALRFGCSGLLGIHWRTHALAPNIAALAAAGWDQSWIPATYDRNLPQKPKHPDGAIGGNVAVFNAPVAGARSPAAVYQSVRYDMNGYLLTVPDGTYTVTLQFNEPAYAATGKRVFGAAIQGKPVLADLDIFAKVGQNKALDFTFPDMVVTNGALRIDFLRQVEFPCIAGIIIEGTTHAQNQVAARSFVRKINCGGPALQDYEADREGDALVKPSPRDRAMPVEDFYVDFARANFGETVAEPIGKLLARMDGVQFPPASDWKNGPGNLVPNPEPWAVVKDRYAFVAELAKHRSKIKSAGNLERFDYWLNTWRGAEAMAELSCARGQLDKAVAAKAWDEALAFRMEMAKLWTRLLSLQTAIVSTPGELGTISNLEQHTRGESHFLDAHDTALQQALKRPLDAAVRPSQKYEGPARIAVPTVRTVLGSSEPLKLRILVIDGETAQSVQLHWRALGRGRWHEAIASHAGRSVWTATLPVASDDYEYWIDARTAAGKTLRWPATAPELNQTVVVN